ncbi:MAG: thioredoxin domain-containing protein [Clostridiaceae bacterium]|nr:thioredoxin domain-containing protein [Eubacteriales bacterium]
MPQEPGACNRLIREKSPYLLQHAHNPVDWYPWCDEAFQRAKDELKPVLLSIGYSTCHWCHVMAHECFEDEEVALVLNRAFVCVKVDREERPDVDAVYMAACVAMNGSGGWPLTVLMTPEKEPFFAGTYLPKASRYGEVGFLELLHEVERLWRADRPKLLRAGARFSEHLSELQTRPVKPAEPSRALYLNARDGYVKSFDPENGGFGGAPKFPMAHDLLFLLGLYALERDGESLFMAEKTLAQMYRGGIYDHIGGGFSRYSTDGRWLAPHFEKMLYDNALLSLAYTEAHRHTGKPLYARVARETLDFCLKELLHADGGFFCAQDADSGGKEGKYYVFRPQEIYEVLGAEAGRAFCEAYGAAEGGNFEGKSILHLLKNEAYEGAAARFLKERQTLYTYRRTRARLHTDDKILTAWNSLMLMALCRAAVVLDEPRYLDAALRLRRFLSERLCANDRLRARWRDGEAAFHGGLDDYAFYALALVSLYESAFDANVLRDALSYADALHELFFDAEGGGYFLYAKDSEQLLTRPKETFDGALPSGNAAAALLFLKLWRLTGQKELRARLDAQLRFLAGAAGGEPLGHSLFYLAMLETLSPSTELICTSRDQGAVSQLHKLLRAKNANNLTALFKTEVNSGTLFRLAPYTLAYPVEAAATRFYVCHGGSCKRPVSTVEEAQKLL